MTIITNNYNHNNDNQQLIINYNCYCNCDIVYNNNHIVYNKLIEYFKLSHHNYNVNNHYQC